MDMEQLGQRIDAYIEANREQIVRDMAAVIRHHSVKGEAGPGAPYGLQVRAALDEALAIARRMGLRTNDGDGYVGWAELPGAQDGYVATITHLDVVPEGEGWAQDPYELLEKDGWLIGRGVEDDKGPGILCLHAAAVLKELGEPLRYGVRVLLGCDEESGMEDVDYYLEHNPQPLFCFSPDADFPLCNGEKGIFEGEFVSAPVKDGNIIEIQGGSASNVIPDRAYCVVKARADGLQHTEWVRVTDLGGGTLRLEATGIGGHAAHPEGTVNAIARLVEYLLANSLCTDGENTFLALLYKLHCATDGSGLDIACRDEVFDPLTIIGGTIDKRGDRLAGGMDCRFPTAVTGTGLLETLKAKAAQHGAAVETETLKEPFYINPQATAIDALLSTYNEIKGQDRKPFTMGGGTYARKFANAVSFGPADPELDSKPDWVGNIHGANEGISLQGMLQALKVYTIALYKLQQLDL